MSKPYFPMFVDLSRRRALVVGAGKIAARRVGTLMAFCNDIAVVAPDVAPGFPDVPVLRRRFEIGDLNGADLVLACTDDGALNAEIAGLCRARGIPVNVSSDQGLCDFFFPGVAIRGSVVAGVTAGGTDHALAKRATRAVRDVLKDIQ